MIDLARENSSSFVVIDHTYVLVYVFGICTWMICATPRSAYFLMQPMWTLLSCTFDARHLRQMNWHKICSSLSNFIDRMIGIIITSQIAYDI